MYKKGVGTYMILLIVIAFFMSIVVFSFIDLFFTEDPIDCFGISYEVKNECYANSKYTGLYTNKGNMNFKLQIGDKQFDIPLDRTVAVSYSSKGLDTERIELIPLVKSSGSGVCSGPNMAECMRNRNSGNESSSYIMCYSQKKVLKEEERC